MRIRRASPLEPIFSSDMVATTSVFDTMTQEEEDEALERIRSLSKRLSSIASSAGGGRRSSLLADVVSDVKDSLFRKFVKSTLSLVTTMRKEEKRSVKELFCEVVGGSSFRSCFGSNLRTRILIRSLGLL